MDPINRNILPPSTSPFSQPPILASQPLSTSSSESQAEALKHLLQDAHSKLRESTVTQPSRMDPPRGTTGQGGTSTGGQGKDPGVLNGLLPRIETRGSGRGGTKSNDTKGKGNSR